MLASAVSWSSKPRSASTTRRARPRRRGAPSSHWGPLGKWGGRGVREGREKWGGDALREARGLLERSPETAKSAFSALIKIGEVAETCDEEAEGAVRAAERAVRDVVVLRCRHQAQPTDRIAFLAAAVEAFGGPLDPGLKSVLLLAHHKIFKAKAKAKAAPF